jgi:hypothetical protein
MGNLWHPRSLSENPEFRALCPFAYKWLGYLSDRLLGISLERAALCSLVYLTNGFLPKLAFLESKGTCDSHLIRNPLRLLTEERLNFSLCFSPFMPTLLDLSQLPLD